MDISQLIEQLKADGAFQRTANLPGLTLGLAGRRYLGATLLPTRTVTTNAFRDNSITYRTVMANTGTRYSPVVIEKGAMVGSMLVELGEFDIGSTFTAEDYDALVQMIGAGRSMEAQAEVLNWTARTLALPIQERLEKQRWEALDDARVIRRGANGYEEIVEYPNPDGHRIEGGSLKDEAIDPIEVLLTQQQLLSGKGYRVSRIVTSQRVAGMIARHPKVRAAIGGEGRTTPVRITREILNGYLQDNELPALETYDLSTRNRDGSTVRFKRENAVTMAAETGRDAQIDLPDGIQTFSDTLGYAAIGRAAGQPVSGIVTQVEYQNKKPVGLYGETYATGGVVVSDPEAVAVVNFALE